jgi:hypothetical protein
MLNVSAFSVLSSDVETIYLLPNAFVVLNFIRQGYLVICYKPCLFCQMLVYCEPYS